MDLQINGEWIEVDAEEYKEYVIGKANNVGYDD